MHTVTRKTPSPIDIRIGRAVKAAREAAAMLEHDAAAAIEVSLDEYQKRESGRERFTAVEIYELCTRWGISFASIFDRIRP